MEVAPGDRIAGKYRVERVLGQGGMGVVVAAVHEQLDQHVALKFLLPKALENAEVVQRFAREARAAAKIHSEHVARVIDVGELPSGAPFMVMEYLEGRDLAEELESRGPLPVADVVGHLLQASEALAEAHAAGIVHRDLKPANLFLAERPDGTYAIKVLDFGISKLKDSDDPESADMSLTKTATVMGSPLYMSPEQMRSARDVDHRGDIWSMGVIAYELLTGETPFAAENMTELISMVLLDDPRPLRERMPSVPEAVEQAVLRCLAKKPEHRYANVAQLARALAPFGTEQHPVSLARIEKILKRAGMATDSLPPAFTVLSQKAAQGSTHQLASSDAGQPVAPRNGSATGPNATVLVSSQATQMLDDGRASDVSVSPATSAAEASRESMPEPMTDTSLASARERGSTTASLGGGSASGMRPAYWFGGIAVLAATGIAITQFGTGEPSAGGPAPSATIAQDRPSPAAENPGTANPATEVTPSDEPEVTPSSPSGPIESASPAASSLTAAPVASPRPATPQPKAPPRPTAAAPTAPPSASPPDDAPPVEAPPPPPPKNPLDLELK